MEGCINMQDNLLNPAAPCGAVRELGARIEAALAVLEDEEELTLLQRNKTARLLLTEALRRSGSRREAAPA